MLPIKGTSKDILDLCLGKPYFNGGIMIPEADGEIIIRALLVGPYQLIVECCAVQIC